MGIATEHLKIANGPGVGALRTRGLSTGFLCKTEEILEKGRSRLALLAICGGDAGFLKEGFESEALGYIQRRHIDIKTRDADLVLRQSRGQDGSVIQSRAEISCNNQKEESSIDGILWPPKWSGLELIANLFALLAGTHSIQNPPAHGMRRGVAGMADE